MDIFLTFRQLFDIYYKMSPGYGGTGRCRAGWGGGRGGMGRDRTVSSGVEWGGAGRGGAGQDGVGWAGLSWATLG